MKKQDVSQNNRIGIRLFMIWLMLSVSITQVMAVSIDTNSIVETPYYKSAIIDFETDEDAITLLNLNDGINTQVFDVSSTPQKNHTIFLQDLDPDKTYDYELSAQDPDVATEQDTTPSRSFQTNSFSAEDLMMNPNIPDYYGAGLFQVKGRTLADAQVTLILNNQIIDVQPAAYDGQYTSLNFRFDTELEENTLQLQAYDEISGQTWTSEVYVVKIDVDDPILDIEEVSEIYQEDAIDLNITVNENVTIDAAVVYEDDSSNPYVVEDDLEVAAGQATISFPLDERSNEITIRATDKSGNYVQKSIDIYVDTVDPEILETNINELSPSYTSQVEIKGKVSEPNIRVQVFVNPEENNFFACSDGVDNDGDGLIDYGEDPGCDSPDDIYEDNPPLGSGSAQCNDGIDNDGDGLIDYLEDPGCTSLRDNSEVDYNKTVTECNDGIDNDGDGRADFLGIGTGMPADWGCTSLEDNSEDSENSNNYFETFSNSNGEFSVDVELDDEFAFYEGIGVENMQGLDPTTNAGAANEENSVGMGAEYSSGGVNDIRIIAIDRANRRAIYNDEITLATCGGGGEWNVVLGQVYPAILQPDLIFQGLGQFSLEMDFEFFGDDPTNSVQINSINFNKRQLSEVDETDLKPHQMLENPTNQCTFLPEGAFRDKSFVVCDLSPWPPERRANLTEGYERLEDIGMVQFPLDLEFTYSYENSQGEIINKVHRECTDIKIGVDQRVDPDFIPSELLNSTVNFLESVIEQIDRLLVPIRTAKLVTMGACFGTMAVQFMNFLLDTAACSGIGDQEQDMIAQAIKGCSKSAATCEAFEEQQFEDLKKEKRFTSCVQSIESELRVEKMRNNVCDRIFCPAVPSAQAYIRQVNDNPFENQDSACIRSTNSQTPNPWSESTVVDAPSSDNFNPKEGCGKEYNDLFAPSCLLYNPVAQSKELERPNDDPSGLGVMSDFMNNLRFCQNADRYNRSQYFRERDTSYYQDQDNDCYKLGVDKQLAQFKSSNGLQNQRTIDSKTKEEAVSPAEIPNNLENRGVGSCVETSQTGELIYQPQGKKIDADGNVVTTQSNGRFDSQTNKHYMDYDAQTAVPIKYGDEDNQNQRMVSVFQVEKVKYDEDGNPTKYAQNLAIDSEGNYYDIGEDTDLKKLGDEGVVAKQISPASDSEGKYFSQVCQRGDVAGKESYAIYNTPGAQSTSTKVITNPDGDSRTEEVTENNCRKVYGPDEASRKPIKEILINPTDGIINAVRCVCLPAIEGYLTVWRNVLNAVKNCFQSVLLTGEFQAGACRSLLTQYLCDLIFEAIKCFFNASALTAEGVDTGKRSGPLAAFSAIQDAGKKVGNSVDDRYGDTATYNSLINNRRLLHAVCLAAFGYDFIPELDQAVSIQGGGFSINSTALVPVATRRLAKMNPNDDGKVTFIYNIGYFLSAGANVNWRVEMKCSNDYSCSAAERFEGGRCDCSYEQNQNPDGRFQNPYIIDSGYTAGGTTVGDGDGNGNVYREITAPIRYDKVRLAWIDSTGGNQSGSTGWKDIRSIGDILPPTCYFSLITFRFACDHSASNQYGDVFFNEPKVSLNSPTGQYYKGEELLITVYASQNFGDIPQADRVQKYAKAVLKSGGTKVKEWITLHGALETTPVIFGDYRFGSGEITDAQYGVSRSSATFGESDIIIPFTKDSVNSASRGSPGAIYVWTECSSTDTDIDPTKAVLLDPPAEDSDNKYCEFKYQVQATQQTEDIDLSTPSTDIMSDGNTYTIGADVGGLSQVRTAEVNDLGEDLGYQIILGETSLEITDGAVANLNSLQTQYLPFTSEAPTASTSAVCSPGVEQIDLELEVSLHDGEALYGNSKPNAYEGRPSISPFNYEGEPQTETIPITLICDEKSSQSGGQVSQERPTQECVVNQPTTQGRNCLCGKDPLFSLTTSEKTDVKICTGEDGNKESKTLCDVNGDATSSECVCASTSVSNLADPTNTCNVGKVCEQSGGGSVYSCVTPASN